MSYNPIIRGLNVASKLIARGFARLSAGGSKVRICNISAQPFVCLAVYDGPATSQKLSSDEFTKMKVSAT